MPTTEESDEDERRLVHRVAFIFDPSDDEEDDAADAGVGLGDEEAPADAEPVDSRRSRKRGRRESGDATPAKPRKKQRRGTKGKTQSSQPSGQDGDGSDDDNALAAFPRLLQGREPPQAVARRRQLFNRMWAQLDERMQTVLQRSNEATMRGVLDFIDQRILNKIPAAFVVLGPAATTDMLLFRQLAAAMAESGERRAGCVRCMVRLRSAEAPNLRTAVKTIVQAALGASGGSGIGSGAGNDEDEDDVVASDGRNYLAYDLEAVEDAIRNAERSSGKTADKALSRIVIAFEDTEGFDTALLADLLNFLHAWLGSIPMVLLFGIATSVDMFQARLPKHAVHRLTTAHFDVAPSSAVLDSLVRCSVAASDVPLRLGPALLRMLVNRQHEHVVGMSAFINSLKYAYLCYFYANPLSVFLHELGNDDSSASAAAWDRFLQNPDYAAAIRQLPSFRRYVEALVAGRDFDTARSLLTDDAADAEHPGHALQQAVVGQLQYQRRWAKRQARALHLAAASGVFPRESFTDLYIRTMGGGGEDSEGERFTLDSDNDVSHLASALTRAIHRTSSDELIALAVRLIAAARAGDADLAVEPIPEADAEADAEADSDAMSEGEESEESDDEKAWKRLPARLAAIVAKVKALQTVHAEKVRASRGARSHAITTSSSSNSQGSMPTLQQQLQLRSKYTAAQSKAVRTTVVAQRVQLSRVTAALTEEDEAFTALVDETVAAVAGVVGMEPAHWLWLDEVWRYDACSPYRDVVVPRPELAMERALTQPHDYLACACCRDETQENKRASGPEHESSIRPTQPTISILYQLYREAGPLINVADLWDAFHSVLTEGGVDGESADSVAADGDDAPERRHLARFYQGLLEMHALGYVKATRRKADHVAKVKWL